MCNDDDGPGLDEDCRISDGGQGDLAELEASGVRIWRDVPSAEASHGQITGQTTGQIGQIDAYKLVGLHWPKFAPRALLTGE